MNMLNSIRERLRDSYDNRFEPEGFHALATLYWRVLLVCGLLFLVFVFMYSTSVFQASTTDKTQEQVPTAAAPLPFTQTTLQQMLDEFDARQAQFDALKSSAPTIPDPSR